MKFSIRHCLSFLLLVLASLMSSSQGQEQQQQYSLHQLQAMKDEELESICLQRGFELVKDEIDETTGELIQLTHDDYVEAAQRCIAIEEEMNEILAQHPELAEELDEEIARMQQEKEQKEAEIQRLQADLQEQEKEAASSSSSSKDKEKSAAFMPKAAPSEEEKVGSPQPNAASRTVVDDEEESEETSSGDFDITEEEPVANSQTETKFSTPSQSDIGDDDQEEESDSSDIMQQQEKSSGPEDFTISALSTEIIRKLFQNAERDLKRIVDIILPVVQPMLKAGDVAWKQLKRTFLFFKHDFEKRRAAGKDEDVDGGGENTEGEDSIDLD